jgi:DNA ligase-1
VTLLAQLVAVSQRVGASAARTGKIRELAEFLRSLPVDEIAIAVHYLSGETPQGRAGIGFTLLQQAIAAGAADEASLSLPETDRQLGEIATLRGGGSAARRLTALKALFAQATADEQRFLLALLNGELRQGALGGVMLDAIAAAAGLRPEPVRRAAMYAADPGTVAVSALSEGTAGLDRFRLELFSPIAPMLAQTAADVAGAMQALGGSVVLEWKMDGARIQVHKGGDTVRIFTRSLNEVTSALPEIVESVRSFPGESMVLDGEAIALDGAGRPLPFQITMRRFGRRLNVEALRHELPISAFFFDCLYLDGRSLVDFPTSARFAALVRAVPARRQMPRTATATVADGQAFYEAALAAGQEGLMAKAADAPYQAGSRDARWLKIKRAHTLDLVVLAAEWGHGRRAGSLSNLHLGAIDAATGQYVMLGKTFKGLTDALLEWQTRELLARETHRDRWTVYVRPELVVEIAFSDLQDSPRYPGRLALRLARVKRYRNDKPASQADTMEAVRRLYDAQSGASTAAREL